MGCRIVGCEVLIFLYFPYFLLVLKSRLYHGRRRSRCRGYLLPFLRSPSSFFIHHWMTRTQGDQAHTYTRHRQGEMMRWW